MSAPAGPGPARTATGTALVHGADSPGAGDERAAGEAKLRRARCALVTGLLLGAAVCPAVLLTGQAPAHASPADPASPVLASQAGISPVSVTITNMTPKWAAPGATVTVAGIVTNNSKQTWTHLSVALQSSNVRIDSLSTMEADLDPPVPLGTTGVRGHMQQPASTLRPGAISHWSISFKANEVGMTTFGVYPLTAQLDSSVGTSLSFVNTFLPYLPATHGRYAKSRPAPHPIAWIWPLIDTPLTGLPGQSDCSGSDARALEASMASGRLYDLLSAGRQFAVADKLTWAVDPALLSDANALSACGDGGGTAAANWLSEVRKTTRDQPLFVTPYGNVSLALIRQSHASDVKQAFSLGREIAGDDLQRSVTPPADTLSSGASPVVTGTAWPPDNISSSTLENLVLANGIQTVVLSSDSVSGAPGTAFRVPAGPTEARVLLSAASLTALLTSATTSPGSEFVTSQEFLAETALMARQGAATPIVAAPPPIPQDWQPPAGLAASILSDTASAPWLTPVTLNSLASNAKVTDYQLATTAGDFGSYSRRVLHQLSLLDDDVRAIERIQAPASALESTTVMKAVAALESSAWNTQPRAARLARLTSLVRYLDAQQHQVAIVADSRVTLGGLKGNVPVLIDNSLDYAVTVQLQFRFDQPAGDGVTIQQHPSGLIQVPAHSQRIITLHVQTTQVGSSTITLRLLNKAGQPLSGTTVQVTVQATQFGMVAMIVLAAVLGVFVVVSAARAIRRRPAPPDNPDGTGQGDPDANDSSQQSPGPDNVEPERTELGAAGTSGL
jgi:hypothetical protein